MDTFHNSIPVLKVFPILDGQTDQRLLGKSFVRNNLSVEVKSKAP